MNRPPGPDGLSKSAIQGVFWTGGGQIVRQITSIAASIVLARLLVPEDFGLLGMAMVFVGFSQLFSDFGIGSAIVQKAEVSQLELTSAFWTNIVVGGGLALLLSACAPMVAQFYEDARISPLLMVLAVTLLFSAMTAVPRALLYRSMAFSLVAKAQVAGSLSGAIVAVAMAVQGYGVWSLAAQPVVGNLVNLLMSWRLSQWMPSLRYAWDSIRELVRFSYGVLGSSVLTFSTRNLDDLLIGKFIGSVPLGHYSFAYQLMIFPISQVSSVLVKVLFPTLSNLQDDLPRFRRAYLKSIGAISFVTFPMMMGLLAVSEEFVVLVFGDKWTPMIPVLKILCLVGMFQSVGTTVGTLYLATARTTLLLRVTFVSGTVTICSFFIGLPWGIVGVAASYAGANALLFYFTHVVAYRQVGLRISDLHATLGRTLGASVLMLVCIEAYQSLGYMFLPSLNPWLQFGSAVTVGVIVYGMATMVINRVQVREISVALKSVVEG